MLNSRISKRPEAQLGRGRSKTMRFGCCKYLQVGKYLQGCCKYLQDCGICSKILGILPVELGLWEDLLDSWAEKNGQVKIHRSETIFVLFTREQGSQVWCPPEALKALIVFIAYCRVLSAHQSSGCLCLGAILLTDISRQPCSLILPLPLLTVLVSNKLTSSLILQILFYCLSPLNLTALCCLIIHSACLTLAITMDGWFLNPSVLSP